MTTYEVDRIRLDFPIFMQKVHDVPLIYLDNAATTQKPQSVIHEICDYYRFDNANVHRGAHTLSERATRRYEQARDCVQAFINAGARDEVVFVRSTTEAINLVADSLGRCYLREGDKVLISEMEHHANIVPWQLLKERIGIELCVVPVTEIGEVELSAYKKALEDESVKLVSIVQVSNVLGTVNPIRSMIQCAKQRNVPVLVDGAQAVLHGPVDVRALDCDFYVFSGHKMYGPTGIGVLYAKRDWLKDMPPYQGGGDMISQVSFLKSDYREAPYKFEAGTPNVAGAIGLAAAIRYLGALGMQAVNEHERQLLDYANVRLNQELPGIKIIGQSKDKAPVLSFTLDDIHAHDIATVLDNYGIAIRAGHHCAMPLMQRFKVPATTRVSFALYNTKEEVDALVEALKQVRAMFLRGHEDAR